MFGFEIVGLILGAIGLVPIFKEGHKLVQSYRKRRRFRSLGFITRGITTLESETLNGETTIANRYQGFFAVYGDAFAQGDCKSDVSTR